MTGNMYFLNLFVFVTMRLKRKQILHSEKNCKQTTTRFAFPIYRAMYNIVVGCRALI